MSEADLAVMARDALLVMLKLSGPVLLAGLAVGFLVSMLQALTQINESTLVFIPKLVAVGATIGVLGGFMMGTLTTYARSVFDQIVVVGLS
jgi:flagellar biosynthetic protein FliQ